MKYLSAFIFCVFLGTYGISQTTSPTPVNANETAGSLLKIVRAPVTVPKFAASPVIDGKLDDEIWKHAAILRDLIQTSPGDNISASKPTEVYLGYDEKNFYVAFKCWDEKDKIRSSVVQRDRVFGEDYVQFWLDTYNDQRRAYTFGFNPLGIQQDGVQTEGQGTDFNVDFLFESKGVIEDWGWSVEVKIPFKSIHYEAGKGKAWGFNAARGIARLNGEFDSWVALPRGVPGFLNKFGKITGLDDIKTERTLEIIPTFTVKETGTRTSLTHFSNPPMKTDFGFTAKYSISPNVTLDAAYNPDFADTEADAPVVEANQRFPIYFSEKRPFFLEGVDVFRTPIQAVYTRRIENPDIAFKLTGKVGKNSFGILGAIDDPLYNPSGNKAYAGIMRLKRDIGKESSIGFLATTYSYPQKHNTVAGFDTRWKIDKQSGFNAQILASTAQNYFRDIEADTYRYGTGNGISYSYGYNWSEKNYSWGASGSGTTDKFRADLGFTRQTNTMGNYGYFNLNSDPSPTKTIIRKYMSVNVGVSNDFSGRLQGWNTGINGGLDFKNNANIGGGFSLGPSTIYEEEFGTIRNSTRAGAFFGEPKRHAFYYGPYTYFSKQFNKRVSLDTNFSMSFNTIDYDFGAGPDFPRVSPAAIAFGQSVALDPGSATGLYAGGGVSLKPTDKFSLSISYNKSRLKRNATNLVAYDSNYFSLGTRYQFSQYVNLKARIYYDTLSARIFGQYTFAWTPSVGKALYVGYTDNWNYNGYAFGEKQNGLLQLNRTFFIKMTYLFRKSF